MANYNTSTLITTNLDEIYGLICIGTDNTGKVITPESLVNSPSLTGVPLAPTAAIDTNTTQIATTAFVSTAIENVKTIYESVLNADTVALAKGTPVRIVGSTGNEARVVAADASSSFPAQLVLNEDLVVGASGLAVAVGFINNVSVPDASIYSPGDEVWLAAGGGWTTTRPTGSASLQKLGIIVKVNVGGNTVSGILTIANVEDLPNLASGNIWLGDGFGVPQESQLLLGTVGDVDTTSTPPTDKQVLQYQSGTGLWTPADSVANGQVINGTAFFVTNTKPTTRIGGGALVAGDKWYKPDEGTEWFWNGTYWLSLPEYSINWIGRSLTSDSVTTFANTFTPNWDLSTQLFFTKLKVVYTLSTADSSNHWQVGIFRVWNVLDVGTLVTLTSPATNGVITNTLNQAMNSDHVSSYTWGFMTRVARVGSPGTLEVNQAWTYRKIAQ